MNKYLKKHNKLELITQLKNKDHEYYKLNIRISNYFYILNRYMPVFNIRSLINNLGLFLPTHLLKPEPNVIFSYRLRYLYKLFLFKDTSPPWICTFCVGEKEPIGSNNKEPIIGININKVIIYNFKVLIFLITIKLSYLKFKINFYISKL